ncbi:MAG: hypothetical protein AAF514_08875 [Verrucomicrobiota bacterium]
MGEWILSSRKRAKVQISERTNGAWSLRWQEAGKWKRTTATNEARARERALDIAEALDETLGAFGPMSATEHQEWKAAKSLAGKRSIALIVEELYEANTILMKSGRTILESARMTAEKFDVGGDIDETLAKWADDVSGRKLTQATGHNYSSFRNQFRERFAPGRLQDLTKANFKAWIETLPSVYSQRTILGFIGQVYKFAGIENPMQGHRLAKDQKEVEIYSREEVALMVEKIAPSGAAWLALMLFGSCRGLEALAVCRDPKKAIREKEIFLSRTITKTPFPRVVPRRPAFDRLFAKWDGSTPRFSDIQEIRNFRNLVKETGVSFRRYALRRTCASHLVAAIGLYPAAEIGGHAPTILKRHYLGLVSKENGLTYFE